ncbi:MAG: MFS transporter [Treponema sp.]|jgi:MFS family permease|nr:MFS transporter [Treponema sp.]
MLQTNLSPYRLSKARSVYNLFNVFNSLSWNFLVGSIVTLFAMRMKASSTYIGLLNAVLYVSFFFLPVGKLLARRFSIIGIFSFAWTWRALCMLPVVFAPFAAMAGHRDLALGLLLLGVALFHIIRGIGMIGNNPILSLMATGPDRGSYMTQIQIINSAVGMMSGFVVAILLGREPPLFLYSIIMAGGIATGIASGVLMRKVPEPPSDEGGKKVKFAVIFKEAMAKPELKQFVLILFIIAMVSGVSRAFIMVYSREVFNQNDGMVSLYTVFGGLGTLMIGLLIKFFVDRVGAKPIFIITIILGLVSMFPIVFFPRTQLDNITGVILFLTFLFFMMNFGFLGAEGIAQTYFLALVPSELMMDMGILYFLIFGISGASGSFLGGLFLDAMTGAGLSQFMAFKVFYVILILLTGFALFLTRKLTPLGALPFKGALEVMFSYRDLRAISLLDKLNRTSNSDEEAALLGALHETPSQLSIKGLLERAESPRLAIRLEAFRAMEKLKRLNEDAVKALIADLVNSPYTTAYISARILGNHRVYSAIPLLRELALSTDYMLAGEAIIALARLEDEAFRPQIENIILKTENPRLKIMGVEAFGIYRSPNSLSVLLDILKAADPPPYLRDEVSLAMAAILDTQNQFYKLLVRFREDESQTATLAMDEAESAFEYYNTNLGRSSRGKKKAELAALSHAAKGIQAAASTFVRDGNGRLFYRWILDLPDQLAATVTRVVLSEAVLDDELSSHNRLKLFIVHWATRQLRVWTNLLK